MMTICNPVFRKGKKTLGYPWFRVYRNLALTGSLYSLSSGYQEHEHFITVLQLISIVLLAALLMAILFKGQETLLLELPAVVS